MIKNTTLLAIDQGTSSSRCILFNERGKIVDIAQKEITTTYPFAGWVEQDPIELYEVQKSVIFETLKKQALEFSQISACGLTNQRETVVLWNKTTSEPIYPATVWQDTRTQSYCDELKEQNLVELIKKKTGLRLDPYFTATKIKWVLDNVTPARDLANKGLLAAGTIDTWLIWKLSNGEHFVTDPSNASRTMLYNIHEDRWDDKLLEILDIPKSILATVIDSNCDLKIKELGNVQVRSILGDQQASLFGHQCFDSGSIKNTYGTGCFMLMNTGSEIASSSNGLLSTIAWRIDGKTHYALEGSIFSGGSTIQWLRDNLGLFEKASDSEKLAREVNSTNGCLLVPAFTGLGAPYWDASARACIMGINRSVNKAHITRAALWSIALQVHDLIKLFIESNINLNKISVDGGASNNRLLMEFQSSLLAKAIDTANEPELTAWGAASLAGLSSGIFKNLEEIQAISIGYHKIPPAEHLNEESKNMKYLWRKALPHSLQWC